MPGYTIIIDSDTEQEDDTLASLRRARTPESSQTRCSSPDLSFPSFNELILRARSSSHAPARTRESLKLPPREGTLRRTSSVPVVVLSDSERGGPSSPIASSSQRDAIVLGSSPDPPRKRIYTGPPSSSPIEPRVSLRKTLSMLDALVEQPGPSVRGRTRPASSSPDKLRKRQAPSSDFDPPSPPPPLRAKLDAAARKAEREAKKAQKAREVAERKRWQEANKLRRSKADTMKELLVDVDDRIAEMLGQAWDAVRERFEADGAVVNLLKHEDELPVIRYRRRVKARLDAARRSWIPMEQETIEDEPVVLVCLEGKQLAQMIEAQTLTTSIAALRASLTPRHQIFLVAQGLARYLSRLRAAADRAYTARIRSQLDPAAVPPAPPKQPECALTQDEAHTALMRLTFSQRVFVVHANAAADQLEWICSLTADISLRPYKAMCNSHLSFSVDVGRAAQSSAAKEEIYRFMLQQIPRVTPHVGNAIVAQYPSLDALYRAYAACEDQQQVDELLQDCRISQNVNGTERAAARRTLGPQLSKRIAAIIMGQDPLALVSGPI